MEHIIFIDDCDIKSGTLNDLFNTSLNNILDNSITNDVHIVPQNIPQYLKMNNDIKNLGNLLLPILKEKQILCYCKSDKIKKIINVDYVDDINNADIIFYNSVYDIEQLNYDMTSDKILIKYNNDPFDLLKILDYYKYITHIMECSQGTTNIVPKIITNKTTISIDYTDWSKKYNIESDIIYFFHRGGVIFDGQMINKIIKDINYKHNYLKYNCISYIINSDQEKEPLIVFVSDTYQQYNLMQIIQMINENSKIVVGKNTRQMDKNTILDYYSLLGKSNTNFCNDFIPEIYDYYINPILSFHINKPLKSQCMYDKEKFMRICAYWYSKNNYYLNKKLLFDYMSNNKLLFNNKKIMILSKSIDSYGGNQKATLQMYTILIKNGYTVTIGCLKEFDCIAHIHNNDVKYAMINRFVTIINCDYDLVIVNKLNEYFKIKPLIKIRDIILTHNSLDPFDKLLTNDVTRILTVNTEHISILHDKGLTIPISQHINYIEPNNKIVRTNGFYYNITFVGRFSREKNLDTLLVAWNMIIKDRPKLTLTIIGSGDETIVSKINNTKNVIYYGQQDIESISLILSKSDYLILPSYTEGLPFVILEAMNLGIPTICSDIIGPNSLVTNNMTGFVIPLKGYEKNKFTITDDWSIMDNVDKYKSDNVINIKNIVTNAYTISFKQWKKMSAECYNIVNKYTYSISEQQLLKNITNIADTDIKFNITNKHTNDPIFMSKISRLQQECVANSINRIDDNFSNYIIFSTIIGKSLKVNSISDLLFI